MVELIGKDGKSYSQFIYFRGNIYMIYGYEYDANITNMIANHLKLENDGILRNEIYSSNTVKALKTILKSKGVKGYSKLKANEVIEEVIKVFDK